MLFILMKDVKDNNFGVNNGAIYHNFALTRCDAEIGMIRDNYDHTVPADAQAPCVAR